MTNTGQNVDVPERSGPVKPTANALSVERAIGLGGFSLSDGLLGQWHHRNSTSTIPLAFDRLHAAGNMANFDAARNQDPTGYVGPVFMDSDVYKTLEAIGWTAVTAGDVADPDFLDTAITAIEAAQTNDGYVNSWAQANNCRPYTDLSFSHELYCAGHLFQAAIALHRSGVDHRLLDVSLRFADQIVKTFARREIGLDGHPQIETALVELYRTVGTTAYLDLARQFIEQRGRGLCGLHPGHGRRYLQDHEPVRARTTMVGHAVRAMYLECGVVDVAVETHDDELLWGSEKRWEHMVATKTAITGGHGSRHSDEGFGDAYELPPDRAYNETCAAIAAIQWSWRLQLATGNAKYAELIERITYNALAAGVSADGLQFFYVNPLQRRRDHYEEDDRGARHPWYSCACCPPNIMRLVASLPHYLATTTENTITIHHPTAGSLNTTLASGPVRLTIATEYPWSDEIAIDVQDTPPQPWTLRLRIPSWSPGPEIAVQSASELAPPATFIAGTPTDSYFAVTRQWLVGDRVHLQFHMDPRLAHPSPEIDGLRGTVAFERGPLVYCFEEADNPLAQNEYLTINTSGHPRELDTTLEPLGRTILLTADGTARLPHPRPWPYQAEHQVGHQSQRSVPAVALPYFQWANRGGGTMRVWIPRSSDQA